MENYITVDCTGSFLKNAGIVGFVKFAEYNHAVEGNDYIKDGQNLHISVEYLKNNDISQMYVNTMVDIFEKDSKFYKVVHDEFSIVQKYYNMEFKNLSDKELENLSTLFKSFEDMMLKKSFENTSNILKTEYNIQYDIFDMVKKLKSVKDINDKYPLYIEIIDILNDNTIKNQFMYTELLYGKFKLFFNENTQSHKITILDEKIRREYTVHNNLISPLLDDFYADTKKKKTVCIECLENTSCKRNNTFMLDTADDVSRKKSYYWNCNPDAFVCPNCTFIYSFVPLGFAFLGNDAIFINNNQSVHELYSIMETFKTKTESNSNETYYQRLFKIFSNEKIDALNNTIHNIQVIVRNGNLSHYDMKIIDNDIISKMVDCKKQFANIEKKYLKIGTDFINVYNSVLDNILMHRSQYGFIDKCLKYEFSQECEKKSSSYGYIKNILKIEINFNGGSAIMEKENKKSHVNNLMIKVNIAFEVGKKMRVAILGESALNDDSKEKDNSLRGYVYRLINLASVGDVAQFMDTVLRTYSGYNLTIPDIFKDCYQSEETFKAIAHGYILGLKYVKYKDDKNKDNQEDKTNG